MGAKLSIGDPSEALESRCALESAEKGHEEGHLAGLTDCWGLIESCHSRTGFATVDWRSVRTTATWILKMRYPWPYLNDGRYGEKSHPKLQASKHSAFSRIICVVGRCAPCPSCPAAITAAGMTVFCLLHAAAAIRRARILSARHTAQAIKGSWLRATMFTCMIPNTGGG